MLGASTKTGIILLVAAASAIALPEQAKPGERATASAQRYLIEKFLSPEPDPLVEAERILILAQDLAATCGTVRIDRPMLGDFVKAKGLTGLDPIKSKEVRDTAGMRFDYLDFDTLHVLCANADRFFGPDGKLLKGLLKSGEK